LKNVNRNSRVGGNLTSKTPLIESGNLEEGMDKLQCEISLAIVAEKDLLEEKRRERETNDNKRRGERVLGV